MEGKRKKKYHLKLKIFMTMSKRMGKSKIMKIRRKMHIILKIINMVIIGIMKIKSIIKMNMEKAIETKEIIIKAKKIMVMKKMIN